MNKKVFGLVFVLLMILVFVSVMFLMPNNSSNKKQNNITRTGETVFGISYPPIQNQEQIDFTIDHMKKLDSELVRFSTTWKIREPVKGEYSWNGLDKKINSFYRNDISILLTINSIAPEWECDVKNEQSCTFKNSENFRLFIRELVKRYSGKIDKIQFGNEWNTEWHFVGTAEEFTEYTNIVYEETKKYSPNTEVVLGGVTRSVPLYLVVCEGQDTLKYPLYFNAGAKQVSKAEAYEGCSGSKQKVEYVIKNAKYDLVDLHMYDEYENWDEYYNALKKQVDVPIIVTEFGIEEGFSPKYNPGESHSKQVEKAMQKLESLGVPEAYYFNLIDGLSTGPHKNSGLITQALKEKPAYYVFKI